MFEIVLILFLLLLFIVFGNQVVRNCYKDNTSYHIAKWNDQKIVEETANADRHSVRIHEADGEECHVGNAVLKSTGNEGGDTAKVHGDLGSL